MLKTKLLVLLNYEFMASQIPTVSEKLYKKFLKRVTLNMRV